MCTGEKLPLGRSCLANLVKALCSLQPIWLLTLWYEELSISDFFRDVADFGNNTEEPWKHSQFSFTVTHWEVPHLSLCIFYSGCTDPDLVFTEWLLIVNNHIFYISLNNMDSGFDKHRQEIMFCKAHYCAKKYEVVMKFL